MAKLKSLTIICLLLTVCLPAFAAEENEYFAVFMQGKKVGHAIHTRRVAGGKVVTSEDVSITISRVGIPVTVKMTETSIETTDGKPLGFESVQLLGAMTMKVAGTISAQGLIEMTNTSLGMTKKSTMPWPKGAVMSEGLRLLTLEKGLKPGLEYTVKLFNAGIMQALEAKVSVGPKKDVDLLGRIVKLTEVSNTLAMPGAGQMSSISYVDDEMRSLKSTMAVAGLNVEMIACAKEFALGDNDVLDLIGSMFVDSPVSLGDPRSAAAITYWIAPNPGAEFVVPTTDNQTAERLADGKIKLVVRPVKESRGGTFPYKGNDPKLLEAVRPTRFLQSDSEAIVALARKAVGTTDDAGEAVRRIEAFVADYIDDKSLSVGYASAAEVLESRQGDCSEFAVLTAALCRAVGIPAQVVVGVAYVEGFAGRDGFGGHAWTQAYVAGKWVGLDAAFKGSGRGGHEAGHIALAVGNGEPADFFNMASALGAFKIEKATIERAQ
jgi:hypothetical protein